MAVVINFLTAVIPVLITASFAALGAYLVAKVNKQATPTEREDSVAKRMEGLVDRLQGELERRDARDQEKDEELHSLRVEVDVLHRLVSACYRILTENNLELPDRHREPPSSR